MKRISAALERRLGADRNEAGETLVETLIAAMLVGVIVVAILGTLGTTILSSKVHRQHADTNTVLLGVMEHVKSEVAVPRVACADAGAGANGYLDEAQSMVPAGSGTVSYTIEYQTISGGVSGWAPTCSETTLPELTLQRINMSLTTDDGAVSRTLSFVKGDF
jgi:Tfp pilus assembly protein PilV